MSLKLPVQAIAKNLDGKVDESICDVTLVGDPIPDSAIVGDPTNDPEADPQGQQQKKQAKPKASPPVKGLVAALKTMNP